MTENTRTASYIGVAVVLLIVAALVNRKPAVETDPTLAGKVLFPALKSPDDVGGLEIVTSEDGVTQTEFNVKRDAAGWSLPSHGGYPADAEKQVASAASSLVDLKALSVVTTSPGLHAEYGVVDPEKASPGAEGIGKLVKVLDKSGNSLARLVIGKKDTATGGNLEGSELWFVRASPQEPVYRVALPTANFSTSFADWIETDLLKLDPWEISEVTLKDYTFDVIPNPLTGQFETGYDQLSTIELAFNDQDSKWSLKNLIQFENDQPKSVELGADEEINSTRLNEMKTALDELKIVGVRPKPAGLSANLKANKDIFNDPQALQSLADRGFYAVPGEGGEPEILSSDGEVLVRMKDGVEYLLRFGGVAGVGAEVKDDEAESETKGKGKSAGTAEEEAKGATLNRFIMVSAQFNKELIPQPELEPLPGEADSEKKDDASKAESGETKTPDVQTETKEPADKLDDQGKDAAKSSDDSTEPKEDDKSAAAEGNETLHLVKLQAEPDDTGKAKAKGAAKAGPNAGGKTDDVKKSATTQEDKSKSAKKSDVDAADEAKAVVDDAKASDEKPSPEDKEDLALRRKRIETENERKQKEYDEKIKKGEEKARELNARFAEWYYVVSEDTYRKIHLNRDDVIKTKAEEKKDDSQGADAGSDPLSVPPLTVDPFQKRDEAAKGNDE